MRYGDGDGVEDNKSTSLQAQIKTAPLEAGNLY